MAKKDSTQMKKAAAASNNGTSIGQSINEVISAIETTYKDYSNTLTPRLKLIDLFLLFLVVLGVLQFLFVLLVGTFPFNAFLGGFISCVGQFVLTVSLRLQYNADNNSIESENKYKKEILEKDISEINSGLVNVESLEEDVQSKPFKYISPERAFGDFIFASLILHFIVYHFIN